MISTVIFDIGGVFFHQPDDATHDFRHQLGFVDQALVDLNMYKSDLWNTYKRGGMTEEKYWKQLINQMPIEYNDSWETLCQFFDQAVKLDTDLVTIARELKKKFKVHALSNAGVELERRLLHFGIRDLFEKVINSHYVKMAKPDNQIYSYTSELIGAKPEEIFFVDDKPRNTVIANEMGWNTYIYTNAKTFYDHLNQARIING